MQMKRKPSESGQAERVTDDLRLLVGQSVEEARERSLPHVKRPARRPVGDAMRGDAVGIHWGVGDPGALEDMLTGAPLYCMSLHAIDIPPGAPVRGAHRHAGAPSIISVRGGGWERNSTEGQIYYEFGEGDLLVVPAYTNHQHGADPDIGGLLISAVAIRVHALIGIHVREQFKFSERPIFKDGTEPINNDKGELVGYRIKKGVLGLAEDLEVFLGAPTRFEEAYTALSKAAPWKGEVKTTYDRYRKHQADTSELLRTSVRVIYVKEMPWELTPQGKIKFMLHPQTNCAAKPSVIYYQEIAPGGRSGKHRHPADEWLYVVKGRGYDVHDGVEWVWEEGDLICVPPMATHQHFNDDPNEPALLISASSMIYTSMGIGGIEQLENAPEYQQEGGA